MLWVGLGLILAGLYGLAWALMIVASDADDESIREWERQQAEWRRDDR